MTRRIRGLAWVAAGATYLLIVLGAVVRITGSGLGCGDDWPVCHGHFFPSFADIKTLIEWNHRLVAALVSALVALLAVATWWGRRAGTAADREGERSGAGRAGYVALGLLLLQVALGAVTVRLQLPPWTVILHLGTAMLLLATLIVAARGHPVGFARSARYDLVAAVLGFVTVLFGGLTANLGAATACIGFPLCNGQLVPSGNALQYIQWTHRLLAYALFAYLVVWTARSGRRGVAVALGLVAVQIGIAATMVLLTVPKPLQAAHAAAGATVWAALVLAATRAPAQNRMTST